MDNYTIFFNRYSKILGETGKQEILQQMFQKFQISNRLSNRYFPKIDVGCPCHFDVICDLLLGSLSDNDGDGNENGKKAIDKQNNNFARASRFFVHFFGVTARLKRENA